MRNFTAIVLTLAGLTWGCQAPAPAPSPSPPPPVQASASPVAGQLITPDGQCSVILPGWKVIDVDPDFQAVFDSVQASLAGGSSSARVDSELLLSARDKADQVALHWSIAAFTGKAPIVYEKPDTWEAALQKQMKVQFPTSQIETRRVDLPAGPAVRVQLSPGPGDKTDLVHVLYVVPRSDGRFSLTFSTPTKGSVGFAERTEPLARTLNVPAQFRYQ